MAKSDKPILLLIYKIEDKKGSEDGCGFEIALRAMEEFSDVTIVTRTNNVPKLKQDARFDNATLVSLDVPKWLGWFKKGERGIILFYYLWQYVAGQKIKQLLKQKNFATIHLVNFHTDWCPHFIPKSEAKIVWGPVIHHGDVPREFMFASSWFKRWVAIGKEYLRRVGKAYFWRVDPFMKPAVKRTDVVIYGNNHIAPPFKKHAKQIVDFPYGGSIFEGKPQKELGAQFDCLFVGRLVNLKGTMLALEAFRQALGRNIARQGEAALHLTFVANGVLKPLLEKKIAEYGLQMHVTLVPHIPQQELQDYYQKAHLFLFPSFESQGLVVSEAMSFATPVCTIQGHGPHYIAAETSLSVPITGFNETATALSGKIEEAYGAFLQEKAGKGTPYHALVKAAFDRYKAHLHWDAIYGKIAEHYVR